ncbi:MAG: hypothetical protein Q7T31_06985, partial [Dietzia sp.]|nr:hypothetical protein [Dietzia sp.]
MRSHTRAAFTAATALTLALTTAACASDDSPETPAATDQTTSAEATGVVILEDGWAKATGTDMAGVFGTIRNPGDDDLHLYATASTAMSAPAPSPPCISTNIA